MLENSALSPTQFVEGFNAIIEYNLPAVVIEGELAEFKVSKNKWLYFNIVDEQSSVRCFGTVFMLKTPLEDGMLVRIQATPKLHQKFNFSLNLISIMPTGEGALKRSAEILKAKLQAEGLFNNERKRGIPFAPARVGLLTSENSAAYFDFLKVADDRWLGTKIMFCDTLVQGENAPASLLSGLNVLNQLPDPPEIIVITRGGGSTEDLSAFNDEQLVRAIAQSRVPVLVAVGHEVDWTLAELVADLRASTPSGAANALFPDKTSESRTLKKISQNLRTVLLSQIKTTNQELQYAKKKRYDQTISIIQDNQTELAKHQQIIEALNPLAVLRRGYSVLSLNSKPINSIKGLKKAQLINNRLTDGTITSKVYKLEPIKD